MSFAMDELGNSYGNGIDNALKAKITSENKVAEKATEVKPEEKQPENPAQVEASDVFDSIKQKQSFAQVYFQDIQEQSTAAGMTSAALQKFSKFVDNMKESVTPDSSEAAIKKSIDENYQKIVKTAKETKFNDEPLIEETKVSAKKVSLEELDIPEIKKLKVDTPENIKISSKKLDEIADKVSQKQVEVDNKQEAIIKAVNSNSLVELKPSKPVEITVEEEPKAKKTEEPKKQETEEQTPEEIKKKVINDIYDSPHKSVKMQIKHIDRNLLLAMISLRAG